uniref:Uncharacterized protein n=1 Tax=Anguilla anguilla TaxID=7936 RepID=A0A0E9V5U5_ANGAN
MTRASSKSLQNTPPCTHINTHIYTHTHKTYILTHTLNIPYSHIH